MRTRSFQECLEKRLSKEEITEIEEQAELEIPALRECPYNHIPNKKTIKAIKDSYNKKNLVECKDMADLIKKLSR